MEPKSRGKAETTRQDETTEQGEAIGQGETTEQSEAIGQSETTEQNDVNEPEIEENEVVTKIQSSQQVVKYTVKYDANGGQGAPTSQIKYKGKTLTLSTKIPTRSGYDFEGWAISKTSKNVAYKSGGRYVQDRNITLYAVWKTKIYKVVYNAKGGISAPEPQIKTHGKRMTITKDIPKKAGYDFMGWSVYTTGNTVKYKPGDAYTIDKDITLYAVWKEKVYKIIYDANMGTGAPKAQSKKHGEKVNLSSKVLQRTGYKFEGWSTSKRATEAMYLPGAVYSKNASVRLYAVWKPNTYKVIYNLNGGKGGPEEQQKKYGMPLVLSTKTPSKSGYVFLGWGKTKDSTTISYKPGEIYSTNKALNLYALWGKQKVATYNDNVLLITAHLQPALLKVSMTYTEYYMTTTDKVVYLKHSGFFGMNVEQMNEEDDIVTTEPLLINHMDGKKTLKKLNLDKQEKQTLSGKYQYVYSRYNDTRTIYPKDNGYMGTLAMPIVWGGTVPGNIPMLKIELDSNGSKRVKSQLYQENSMKESEEWYRKKGNEAKAELRKIEHLQIVEDDAIYNEKIEKMKKAIVQGGCYEEMQAFIEGTGYTEEEYWEITKKQLVLENTVGGDE